jgi:hypothetical protein
VNVLGINSLYHESAAALLVDGTLVAAVEGAQIGRDRRYDRAGARWPNPHREINAPCLYQECATSAECSAGLRLAIERGWLLMHESGTFVKFTQAGAELFA